MLKVPVQVMCLVWKKLRSTWLKANAAINSWSDLLIFSTPQP